jgi:TetR/AcrR family transcriptional regulator, cholesterol catabolism regulator
MHGQVNNAGEMNGTSTDRAAALGRRERRKLEVVQRIRRAARELFAGKGYDATTVEEIAERADIAKATFFNHFPRKDALLRAFAEDLLDEIRAAHGAPETWRGSAVDQLRRLFQTLAATAERDPALYRTVVIENMRTFWDKGCRAHTEAEFRKLTRGLVRRAVELGELNDDVDVDVGASLLEAAYMTTIIEWLREGAARGAVRRTLDAKFDVIFDGLGRIRKATKGT